MTRGTRLRTGLRTGQRAQAALGAMACLLAWACMDAPAGLDIPLPRDLLAAAGDEQQGIPGRPLAQPIVVRLLGPSGGPLAGFDVAFEVEEGGGVAEPRSAVTDASGEARTTWTMGPQPGANRLRAVVQGVGLPPARFRAEATSPPVDRPQQLLAVSGDGQTSDPGFPLRQPVVVRVIGTSGSPLRDVEVSFDVEQGGGSITPAKAATDSLGEAKATWTLGSAPGTNQLRATAAGLELPVRLRAEGAWSPGKRLVAVAGGGAQVAGGCALPEVVVRVLDDAGRPAQGARVQFAALKGSGTADPLVGESDAEGLVRTTWRTGHEGGSNELEVSLARPDSDPLKLSATAIPRTPGGFAAVGNQIVGDDCRPHRFTGVSRPSLNWNARGDDRFDQHAQEDVRLIRTWGANILRLPVNQSFWVPGTVTSDPGYKERVKNIVRMARAEGLAVIVDLHVSDRGDPNRSGLSDVQQMPDRRHSIPFWRDVAETFKDDGGVLFELYNEPHDIEWDVWRNGGWVPAGPRYPGGPHEEGFEAAGIQELYDAVRSTGARNIVIVNGTHWGYYLTGVPENPITGYNVAYSSHPYDWWEKQPNFWDDDWGFMGKTHPIIVTEFGARSCEGIPFSRALLDYVDKNNFSWVAWAWWTPPASWPESERQAEICKFTALLQDWSGTPSQLGVLVKERLLKAEAERAARGVSATRP